MNGELKGNVLSGEVSGEQTLQGSGYPKGNDGISPKVEVTENESGHRVTITDIYGAKTFDLRHGKDGTDGYTPQKGVDYFDGKDGYTPQKDVDYFDGKDGYTPKKGVDYEDGRDGTSVSVSSVAESTASGGSNVVTFTDGSRLTVKNGRDGSNGKDGYTPKKGVDYTDGKDGVSLTHSWNGTVLNISSASGTSSADLKGRTGDKGDKGDPFTYEDFTEEQIAALRQDRGCLFYSTETFPDADIGNGRTLSVDDISLEGRTIRVNDMVLSGDGLLWAVNYVGADGITGAQCIFNLRGAADAQGCSIYYSSKELNNAEIGKDYYLSISDIHLSNRPLAKNDLIITADGHLFKVYLVREDSAGATCIGCLKGDKGDPGGVQTVNGVEPDANGNVQIETGGGMGGADWNAVEGEPGHIQNKPFGLEFGELFRVDNAQFATDPDFAMTMYPMEAITLVDGEIYTVVWDGVQYQCTCLALEMEGEVGYFLGNLALMGGEFSEEPFAYLSAPSEGMCFMIDVESTLTGLTASQHSFSITGNTIKPIEKKYMPFDGSVDWEQAEPGAGFIKNKPFSYAIVDTVEWGGGTAGKEVIPLWEDGSGNKGFLCKVSDEPITEFFNAFRYEYYDPWAERVLPGGGVYRTGHNPRYVGYYTYGANDLVLQKTPFPDIYFVNVTTNGVATQFGVTLNSGLYLFYEEHTGMENEYISKVEFCLTNEMSEVFLPANPQFNEVRAEKILLWSSTVGSNKLFEISVDDSGTLKVVERLS